MSHQTSAKKQRLSTSSSSSSSSSSKSTSRPTPQSQSQDPLPPPSPPPPQQTVTPVPAILNLLKGGYTPPPSSPPLHLTSQRKSLLSLLRRWLKPDSTESGCVFLTGFRGHGKTMLVEHCLEVIKEELVSFRMLNSSSSPSSSSSSSAAALSTSKKTNNQPFRVIRLNGLIQLDDTSACREIASQLTVNLNFRPVPQSTNPSDNATTTKQSTASTSTSASTSTLSTQYSTIQKSASFHSNMQTLNLSLQHTVSDQTPLIFVLDEVHTFAQRTKQTLLYHLLDQIHNRNVRIVIVGVSNKQTLVDKFERRIRSRSSHLMICLPHYNYEQIVDIMANKLIGFNGNSLADVRRFLEGKATDSAGEGSEVGRIIRRSFALGRDVRWFCRVLYLFVCLSNRLDHNSNNTAMKGLSATHMMTALSSKGANVTNPNSNSNSKQLAEHHVNATGDLRLFTLQSLPQSQALILICIKRIMDRNSERSTTLEVINYEKVWAEYQRFCKKGSGAANGADNFSTDVLFQAFLHLIEGDLIKVKRDHTGGGIYQFKMMENGGWGEGEIKVREVWINFDIEEEFKSLLQGRAIDVSSSLREWGLKL